MSRARSSIHLPETLLAVIRKRRWTEADARAILQAQRAKGVSVVGFARKAGLSVHRLHNWRKKLRVAEAASSARPPRLLPVSVITAAGQEGSQEAPGGLEVLLRGGRRIRVAGPFEPSVLAQLVRTLETLAC